MVGLMPISVHPSRAREKGGVLRVEHRKSAP